MSPQPDDPEMINDEVPQEENVAEPTDTEAVVPEEEMPLPIEPVTIKPRSNVYTLLLVISIVFIIVAIYLVGWELRNYYDATFGMLEPTQKKAPQKTESSEPTPPDAGGQK